MQAGIVTECRWLESDTDSDGVVTVTATGGISGARATTIWSAAEEALEQAAGGLVVLDLSKVTVFDDDSIAALALLGRSSARRHAQICMVAPTNCSLYQYISCCATARLMPMYRSRAAALASFEARLAVVAPG